MIIVFMCIVFDYLQFFYHMLCLLISSICDVIVRVHISTVVVQSYYCTSHLFFIKSKLVFQAVVAIVYYLTRFSRICARIVAECIAVLFSCWQCYSCDDVSHSLTSVIVYTQLQWF